MEKKTLTSRISNKLNTASIRETCRQKTTTLSRSTVSQSFLLKVTAEKNVRAQGKKDDYSEEQIDKNGRITKGPFTLKNGAVYTGQWLNSMRDGFGTQLWPDGSRYEG